MLDHVRHMYEVVRVGPMAEKVSDIRFNRMQSNRAISPLGDMRFVSNPKIGT